MRPNRVLTISGFLVVPGLLVVGWFSTPSAIWGAYPPPTRPSPDDRAIGTPPRTEREYKLGLAYPEGSEYAHLDGLVRLQQQVHTALKRRLADPIWQVPRHTGNGYYVAREPMVLVGRDVYFDTPDHLLHQHAISYRLRHRFKTLRKLMSHEAAPLVPRHFPYRCELQAKVGRAEEGAGFSQVQEARFEFRVESQPFSEQNPPPPPPWSPRDYVPFAVTGLWQGQTTTPWRSLATWLDGRRQPERIDLRPELVLVCQRMRMHLDMKTEFGSGPNPDQAFIISLDRSYVYDADGYLTYLERALYGDAQRPPYVASFDEVEIEFERNVSTVLDQRIRATGDARLEQIYAAFRRDQETLCGLIQEALRNRSVSVTPASQSKYQKAFSLLVNADAL